MRDLGLAVFNGAAGGIAVGMLVVDIEMHDWVGVGVWAVLSVVNVGYSIPFVLRLWFGRKVGKRGEGTRKL